MPVTASSAYNARWPSAPSHAREPFAAARPPLTLLAAPGNPICDPTTDRLAE